MDVDERTVQLYTLEYQKAAERYDNVYRSIWTIFSYLTAVVAGFLVFASDRGEPHGMICIAVLPFLFWFWTTYLPLDRYGNNVLNRLRDIEVQLNKQFSVTLNHFTQSAHPPLSVVAGILRAIFNPDPFSPKPLQAGWPRTFARLWASLERAPEWCKRVVTTLRALWHQVYRARFAIWVFFILLHVIFFRELIGFRNSGKPLFLEKPTAATPVGTIHDVTITGGSR